MLFEKFIDLDLGHVSYIVACDETKEAFIVDPRRDIEEYVDFIESNSLSLKYILNTHTHADYVGGHLELHSQYNAHNIFQNDAPIDTFKIIKVTDNNEFLIGNTLKINILETPGHTPFDICLRLSENNIEKILFSGDTLFIGDIGRPDLLGEENLESLANSSYESAKRLWSLNDDIIVFPSHIKGSLCGKNLSRQYFSTIGIEKKTNKSFALSQDSKEKYMENLVLQNIETPSFFKKMAGININGPKLITKIINNIKEVEFNDIKNKNNIQIIDLRKPNDFHNKHIKGSINISETSNVSFISGNILDYTKDIYLIGNPNTDFDQFIIKLLRVGLDNVQGIINNDFSLIGNEYLSASNIVFTDEITDEFTNILLDKDCNNIGTTIQLNLSDIIDSDVSKYNKVIFSCNFGYKSSAVCSLFDDKNIYYLEQ